MDRVLWADRLIRRSDKLRWTTRSLRVAQPQIEVIQERSTPAEPEGFEYVKRCVGPAYIEPELGYVISENGRLIDESLLTNFAFHKPQWRVGLPSVRAFAKMRRGAGKRVERHAKVISLRHLWEWNYYHFYLDVLGKIQLFDKAGVDSTIPLVLGDYANKLPFVQQIIKQGDLRKRNWIIQEDCYLLADEIYYCRTRQRYKDKMDHLLDLMDVPNHRDRYQDRVFLSRKKNGPRSVVNMEEIEPILHAYDFRIVDTVELSIAEQIDLFSKTRYLVAIHGAGMTNMIFRRDAPMSVLEIHPEIYVSADFWNMCHEWGYEVDRLPCQASGGRTFQQANIHIDPVQLRHKLEMMLAEQAVPAGTVYS